MGERIAHKGSALRRVMAVLMVLLVFGFASNVTVTRASAVSGSIQNPQIRIVNDGTSEVTGDTSDHDGLLALGNRVVFQWEVTLLAVEDGVLTQTLPVGLTWDEASLTLAGVNNQSGQNGFVSSYVLSDEGRTLTVKIATAPGAPGSQYVEFTGITALVDRATASVGDVYAPTLSVTDGLGTNVIAASGTPAQVEIVGQVRGNLSKVGRTINPGVAETHDFGAGEVPAVRHTFGVVLEKSVLPGDRMFEWQGPIRVADTFTLTKNGAPAMSSNQAVAIDGTSGSGLTATLENVNAANGTFEVVFDNIPAGDDPMYANVSVWIPSAQVPNLSAGELPIVMENTVSKPAGAQWRTTDGAEIVDANAGDNTQIRNYGIQNSVSGSPFYSQELRSVPGRVVLSSSGVYTGTNYTTDGQFRPAGTRASDGTIWTAVPSTNVNMFEFWDPAVSELKNSGSVYSGNNLLVENVDYRVYYSTSAGPGFGGPTNPLTMPWTLKSDYTGDLADVASLRVEYIGNGGVYEPAPSAARDTHNLKISPQFEVVRGLPNPNDPADLGRVLHRGQVLANLQTTPPTNYNQGILGELFVRAGDASVTKTGVALNAAGEVQLPATEFISAGQGVRYTITPQLKGLKVNPSDSSSLVIPNVRVTDCLPANVLTSGLDFSRVDHKVWGITVTPNACGSGARTQIVFEYLPEARYADDLAPISFDARTSKIAPNGNVFDNLAELQADGIFGTTGGAAATGTARMYASQPSVTAYEKFTDTPRVLRGGETNYRINWFNFLSSDRANSYFVDVLPFNGDTRGTVLNGEASLVGASVVADAAVGATLQLTTDSAIRLPGAAEAPASSVAWVDYAAATPAEIAQAKALRVHLQNFVAGATSVGSLNMTLTTPDAHGGDVLMNTTNGLLSVGQPDQVKLDEAKPVAVDIVASSISGELWEDVNGNGTREAGEPAIEGTTVQLTRGGTTVASATTDANGIYRFADLDPGEYRVVVDTATLPATTGNWVNTASPAGGSNSESGLITVGEGEDLADQNFGFRNNVPAVKLEKQGVVPAELRAGEPITWTFTVTNTGNMDLSNIEVADQFPGMSSIAFGSWPTATKDLLEPGQSVTATATSPLTQAQLDGAMVENEARVAAVSSDAVDVADTAAATVVLPRAATLDLVKTVSLASGAEPSSAKAGDTLNYAFKVTNNGNVTLSNVELKDQLEGLSTVEFGAWPNPATPGVLKPGETVTATATLKLSQDHIEAGSVSNTASASGELPLLPTETEPQQATDTATAVMDFTPSPAIQLQKSAHLSSGASGVGDSIRYDFVLTNTGSAELKGVALADKLAGLSAVKFGEWPDAKASGRLAPGESVTATAKLTITQAHVDAGGVSNTASARGATRKGVEVSAEDTAKVVLTKVPGLTPGGVDPESLDGLENTGAKGQLGLALAAMVLLIAGGSVYLRARKRRRA
ncbi:hypothetical protein G7068_12240 [Leucobacter viscericola]|uniref:Gram-positive cocci surface proteins LPxTG domain-containing protein n=1 Tax=Leucobacter viscericola TaxID=2714935 RepID=A0A6G7XHM2_9MICO|nr:SdrD B-like domain-containing protein [Leucobacter viscericola]QIK63877.1 hypothetical protein G7068_12240 [Leucobacter viscericola]